ncbi:hypothetical protein KIL84_017284 [Mauremys mutica]|uniref:Uncharacterized protein n=1 Tax=Mauremys mutica TaxID=74926 RepID=A0A9D4AYI5_9SAUR|nr:hypothetical protein KIL84_017284 [Mauremys mutica]
MQRQRFERLWRTRLETSQSSRGGGREQSHHEPFSGGCLLNAACTVQTPPRCMARPSPGEPSPARAQAEARCPFLSPAPEAAGRAVAVKPKAASSSQRFPSPRPSG